MMCLHLGSYFQVFRERVRAGYHVQLGKGPFPARGTQILQFPLMEKQERKKKKNLNLFWRRGKKLSLQLTFTFVGTGDGHERMHCGNEQDKHLEPRSGARQERPIDDKGKGQG